MGVSIPYRYSSNEELQEFMKDLKDLFQFLIGTLATYNHRK